MTKSTEITESNTTFISPAPKNKSEQQAWNRISERMEGFHSYFRTTFTQLYSVSTVLFWESKGSNTYKKFFNF